MPAPELGVLVALGAAGIVVLVVIVWRAVSCRRGRARLRPASPEALAYQQHLANMRRIAALDYAPKRQEK